METMHLIPEIDKSLTFLGMLYFPMNVCDLNISYMSGKKAMRIK
jgi:hypothetical protein